MAVTHAWSLNKRSVPHVTVLGKKIIILLLEIRGSPSVVGGLHKPGFDQNPSPVPKRILVLAQEDAGHVRSLQLA